MTNKYYQKQKEKLRKEACERYQNLSEEQNQNLIEYMRNHYITDTK